MEAKDNPKLPRMTRRSFAGPKSLCASLCANHDHGNVFCWTMAMTPMSAPSSFPLQCCANYFRNAVLPADKELCGEI